MSWERHHIEVVRIAAMLRQPAGKNGFENLFELLFPLLLIARGFSALSVL
jgi:hypothetical protein